MVTKFNVSLYALGLSLLLGACGQQAVAPQPTTSTDLPFVPRLTRPAAPDCGAQAGSVASLIGLENLAGENHVTLPRLQAQADLPENLQSLLFATRSLINTYYYGFSSVDLQALHQKYEGVFKLSRPLNLAYYGIDAAVDQTMNTYIDEIGDDHTFYRDALQAQAYRDSSAGNPTPTPRFGVNTAPVPGGDGMVILNVTGDAPFYLAGLRRGDVITEVNGQALRRTDPDDAKTSAVYSKILSDAAKLATPVTVKYTRKGVAGSKQIAAKIISSTSLPWGEVLTDGAGKSHYYLRIPTFNGQGIADKVHTLVTDARAKGVQDIIIDLRDNGGGRLAEFVGAAAAFSPSTAGETVEYLTANDATYKYAPASKQVVGSDVCGNTGSLTIDQPDLWTGKTAILVTKNSASASELFAQTVKLGGNTQIIGEPTYGVANTTTFAFDLPGDPERNISITAGRGRLLNGKYATQNVTPDIAAKDDIALLAQGTDLALNAAYTYLDK